MEKSVNNNSLVYVSVFIIIAAVMAIGAYMLFNKKLEGKSNNNKPPMPPSKPKEIDYDALSWEKKLEKVRYKIQRDDKLDDVIRRNAIKNKRTYYEEVIATAEWLLQRYDINHLLNNDYPY